MKNNNNIILRQVPADEIYYNFEDIVEINENWFITGNSDFVNTGDKLLIDIINNNYYDDDLGYDYDSFEMLEKLTGKKWTKKCIRGYCQSDWNYIYYAPDYISQEEITEIENFYFGLVSEYYFEDEQNDEYYTCYIPHDIEWKGKKAICDYLGLVFEQVKVLITDGFKKVYNYKEVL